ncbi:hypothetical protein F5148DRAFT_789132 [Russula earlei]|uniref:Uncharacterized protein n=1 Tax=Russula earlei TaxID=71964 RepID=A0ACC0TSP6_9AGAM|nr:hypothetical protein F5148DRAFT_789132 [Russula earlei]
MMLAKYSCFAIPSICAICAICSSSCRSRGHAVDEVRTISSLGNYQRSDCNEGLCGLTLKTIHSACRTPWSCLYGLHEATTWEHSSSHSFLPPLLHPLSSPQCFSFSPFLAALTLTSGSQTVALRGVHRDCRSPAASPHRMVIHFSLKRRANHLECPFGLHNLCPSLVTCSGMLCRGIAIGDRFGSQRGRIAAMYHTGT